MKKNTNYLINLLFIYLAMVLLLGVALYALIRHFGLDVTLATNIMIWSATLFPSIVIIYTFQSWRNQKASEVLAMEAKEIAEILRDQRDIHRKISNGLKFDDEYENKLVELLNNFNFLSVKLSFLESLISNTYSKSDLRLYSNIKNSYESEFWEYIGNNKIIAMSGSFNFFDEDIYQIEDKINSRVQNNERFFTAHLNLYELLIKIMLHSESLSKRN